MNQIDRMRQPAKPTQTFALLPRPGRFLKQWWWVVAFWLLIALASAMEMAFLHAISLQQCLGFALVHWLPWALLTPMIMWMVSAYTMERETWRRTIWLHLLVCLLTVGGLGVLGYLGGPPPFLRRAPGEISIERSEDRPMMVILRRATSQLPTFWAVVGVACALRFYQQAKDKERREAELESRLAQARLQALRMQLNPHFLFNTLNSIASLVDEDPKAADEMIGLLSELLRATLRASDRQEVTLREELELLDRYLAIEQARFGNRLQIEKQVDPAAMDAVVPILCLQPLVENAIKHGVERQLAPGLVRIVVKCNEATLQAQVVDNGPGLAGAPDGKLKEGVGLSNTRARLKELYGARALLKLGAGPLCGFSAEMQIPATFAPGSKPALAAAEQ